MKVAAGLRATLFEYLPRGGVLCEPSQSDIKVIVQVPFMSCAQACFVTALYVPYLSYYINYKCRSDYR
jgi:hypothetical protein